MGKRRGPSRRSTSARTVVPRVRLGRLPVALTVVLGLLAAVTAAIGLLAPGRAYADAEPMLLHAALAQDAATLLVVPLMVGLVLAARRGSFGAWMLWLGVVQFLLYNYAIYAFSVDFGVLFLPWVALLGLSAYTLVIGAWQLEWFHHHPGGAIRWVAGFVLLSVPVVFGIAWLSEITSDLRAGGGSSSAAQWDVPTNPVHVLDLALFLPLAAIAAVLLLRARPLGAALATVQLSWAALTCIPILLTPAVHALHEDPSEAGMVAPFLVVLALTSVSAVRLAMTAHRWDEGSLQQLARQEP